MTRPEDNLGPCHAALQGWNVGLGEGLESLHSDRTIAGDQNKDVSSWVPHTSLLSGPKYPDPTPAQTLGSWWPGIQGSP